MMNQKTRIRLLQPKLHFNPKKNAPVFGAKKKALPFGAKKRDHTSGVYKIEKKPEWKDTINGIRIKDRTADAEAMKRRLRKFKILNLQQTNTRATTKTMPDLFAFYGVISSKTNRTSGKGNAYLMMKVTDFDAEVTLMFFNSQIRCKFYKFMEGTVVCIGNAKLMDSKKKSNSASFIIDDENQMMKIGLAKDFGFCKGKCGDGLRCKRGVNIEKCPYCPFHRQQRMKNLDARRKKEQQTTTSSTSKQNVNLNKFGDAIRATGSPESLKKSLAGLRQNKGRMKSTSTRFGSTQAIRRTAKESKEAKARALEKITADKAKGLKKSQASQVPTTHIKSIAFGASRGQQKRKAPPQLDKSGRKRRKIDAKLDEQPDFMNGLRPLAVKKVDPKKQKKSFRPRMNLPV